MKSLASSPLSPPHGSVLLSLEESLSQVQELRAWREVERQSLCKIFERAYQQWCNEWGLSVPMGANAPQVQVLDAHADHIAPSPKPPDALAAWMFMEAAASRSTSSMATELAQQAWSAWLERIQALTGSAYKPPSVAANGPASLQGAWSGALRITFPVATTTWEWVLTASTVEEMLKQHQALASPQVTQLVHTPLVPLAEAMRDHQLQVCVELDGATLSLGQLQTLAAGDIVALEHLLDQPARMALALPQSGADRTSLCSAWLGQIQGQMAAQLGPQISKNQ